MNLVQIQEHLKGMPIQALMSYANGMNPNVPPYLALGELNRRKQAEQSMQKPEAPQGTVKDRIEGEAGLMALKKQAMDQMRLGALRQQQTAQGQAAQSAMTPQAVPAGAPEPEMQEEVAMAGGGITDIMVPDNVTQYGSGGIVAFADRGLVQSSEGDYYAEPLSAEELGKVDPLRTLKKFAEWAGRNVERDPETGEVVRKTRAPEPEPAPATSAEAPAPTPQPATAPAPTSRPVTVRAPGIAGTRVAQPAQVAQPAEVVPAAPPARVTPAGQDFMSMLTKQATGEGQKTYDEKLKEAEKTDQYLGKQPGGIMEEYLKQMETRRAGEESRQAELEKERTRSALWKSLIAAGEASRGTRGLGALMGGFGRTAGEELEAGRVREEAQMKARREFEDNMAKMRQDIESARIARAQGRFKDANEFEEKAQQRKEKAIEKGAEIQSAEQRDATKFAHDEKLAQIRFEYEKKLKGIPQAQRATLEEQFVDELVKNGKPRADAIREAKTLGTGAERQDLAELKALQKTYQDQSDPTKNFDKASREDAARRLAVVNSKIEQMAGLGGGGGPKEGDKSTSNSGKPIIYRNGRWEYQ